MVALRVCFGTGAWNHQHHETRERIIDCGRLLTPSLERDCLERDTCRIGAEFAR
jgi:hypothetical protein